MGELIPQEVIEQKIFLMRGHKVMLDKDLARLYGVAPRALRQQVKRNSERFPDDFMFRLTQEETDFMVSQNVTPSRKHLGGHLRSYPATDGSTDGKTETEDRLPPVNISDCLRRA